jgi:hypothetical protein
MSKVFGILLNNRISGRSIFESYEAAAEVLEPGTFIEETEETGTLYFAGLWDGEKLIPPTPEEVENFKNFLAPAVEETTEPIVE